MRNTFILLFLLPLTLTAVNAHAAPEPLVTEAHYTLSWSGIPFGACDISAAQDGNRFRINSAIHFSGAAKMLAAHQSDTVAEGDGMAAAASAHSYETYYSTRNKKKHVLLTYAKGGSLTDRLIEPPENPEKRPPVPVEKLKGVPDPLTFIAELRRIMRETLANHTNRFTLSVFDGRRLYASTWTIQDERVIELNGKQRHVVYATATRKPTAGFTQSELDDFNADAQLGAYFDADTMLPVKMTVELMIGTLEATLDASK